MRNFLPIKKPINSHFIYFIPLLILLATRLAIEICLAILPLRLAWIPAFLSYYLCIMLSYRWLVKQQLIHPDPNRWSIFPLPKLGWLLIGVVLPALIPLNICLNNISAIPAIFIVYIILFSLINPIFEECFWRYQLSFLPGKKWQIIGYSALLFSFSHFFLWAPWLKSWMVILPTLISTFIMGALWMLFYLKERKSFYLLISHFFVDVFNLSIAIFYGIELPMLPN